MSAAIQLEFRESPRGEHPPCMRFLCRTFLSTMPDVPFRALVDTGAPFSIVPWGLWKSGAPMVGSGAEGSDWRVIRGVTGGAEPCEFGRIHVRLADPRPALSGWIEIPAQLARTNRLRLTLGVAGFLDTYEVALNRDGESYVVVPGA